MKILTNYRDEYKIIVLEGEFDLYNVRELKSAITNAIEDNTKNLVMDLEKVEFMDSSAIGALYLGFKKMKALNGNFYLSNVSQKIDDVISLTGLDFKRINVE